MAMGIARVGSQTQLSEHTCVTLYIHYHHVCLSCTSTMFFQA